MAISNFLNPIKEQEILEENEGEIDPDIILQEVIGEHLGLQQEIEEEEEQEQLIKPQRSIQEAREALQVVIEFTEGCEGIKTAHLRAVERLEQELEALDVNSRVQSTLDGWLM